MQAVPTKEGAVPQLLPQQLSNLRGGGHSEPCEPVSVAWQAEEEGGKLTTAQGTRNQQNAEGAANESEAAAKSQDPHALVATSFAGEERAGRHFWA